MRDEFSLRADGKTPFFESIDIHFARFMEELSGTGKEVPLASALVSRYTRAGHICVDLSELSGASIEHAEPDIPARCPDSEHWIVCLRRSPVVGLPGESTPLVLDEDGRLYLWRYWDYEKRLADGLRELSSREFPVNTALLLEGLDALFPSEEGGEPDWQKIAAIIAVISGLTVVTGGPGTGKTTVVSRILTLLLEHSSNTRIALTAPTGKAAQKLQESVQSSSQNLSCSGDIRRCIPREACTIHRLLGTVPSSTRSRYSRDHPLPHDVIVVDEASMVALPLMSRLVQALRPDARLILLGDKNQLASVEAGYVLGDICDTGRRHGYSEKLTRRVTHFGCAMDRLEEGNGLQDSIVELEKTFRFAPESGIYRLSIAVNEGDSPRCMDILGSGDFPDLSFTEYRHGRDLDRTLQESILQGYAPYLAATSIEDMFRLFDSFRVLCALREGPFGVRSMNSVIEQVLVQRNLVSITGVHYHGRPVLITANDYALRLFNGDTGIILYDAEDDDLRAFFPMVGARPRKISPVRLPVHETAFAMTVHKSQGSEYDSVLLILPDRDSPVLTRELVYTGITRAKKHLEIRAREDVFSVGVSRRIERSSGLKARLWGRKA
ncbi:MAG: exodeoxyribonuclease V subunit alpha [Desulfomonilia bacterium]